MLLRSKRLVRFDLETVIFLVANNAQCLFCAQILMQKEACGVHPLRTVLSACALRRDYAAFATLRSDLKPERTSSE
jgi:hypothetical protein